MRRGPSTNITGSTLAASSALRADICVVDLRRPLKRRTPSLFCRRASGAPSGYALRARRGDHIRVTSRGEVIAEISGPKASEGEAELIRRRPRGSVVHYESPSRRTPMRSGQRTNDRPRLVCVPQAGVPPDRRFFRRVHLPCPGNRTSQNVQPLTGCCVMLIAAADGLSKRLPLNTSAPDKTSAR